MKAPVYVVKPKNIYRHPFNKYDLDKPTSRETQNEDLSDYFNYGFNEDTMNIYAKLVKRTIQALDQNANPTYFDAPSQLMRLNDEIPIDFGGFCKFFDTSIFHNPQNEDGLQNMENFHDGEQLFQYLIDVVLNKRPEYPLLEFVGSLYGSEDNEDNGIVDVMEEIEKNLQRKYNEVMKKLNEQKALPQPTTMKEEKEKVRYEEKKVEKNRRVIQQSEESSDDDSSDDSSEESQRERKKRRKRSRSREKRRKRSRSRQRKKKSHHSRKDKKDRRRGKSRSRDKHKRSKDRRKEKSSKKSRRRSP